MIRSSRVLRFRLFCIPLLLGCAAMPALASPLPKGPQARRVSGDTATRSPGLANAVRQRVLKPAVNLGSTGASSPDPDRPFSVERALESVRRIESLGDTGTLAADESARARALELLPAFRRDLGRLERGEMTDDEVKALAQRQAELENLEGLALKGKRPLASYHPVRPVQVSGETLESAGAEAIFGGIQKVNTGWILDQHLFDPDAPKNWPTILQDYRNYDEGQNDIAMGHSDHPAGGGMFGWMWQVHSFYLTEIWSDHPNASYCLFVLVSGDGGASWILYNVLYDPATSPATSKDLINPKLAVDVSGTYDIYYLAYEWAFSSTDHDVYVYYDTSTLPFYDGTPGGTSNPHDVGVGTSTNMERNPAIASEYKTSDATGYQVVAYEYAYSATDYDIRAAQSYGNGSATWTTAVDVAATAGMETHPALTAGCSGGSTFTAYTHLAYNYDTYTSGTTQLLLNPGFESGNDGNWTVRVAGDISCNGANTHAGTCKAWLGGVTGYPSWPGDWIYQTVTIPPGVTSASFSFWLKIVTAETSGTWDYFYADVRDTSGTYGNQLQNLVTLTNADSGTYAGYQQLTYDLSQYRGQTVRIFFWATNDGSNATSFYVDDAALNIGVYNTASEIRYANASHPTGTAPGTTPYPTALGSYTKVTVLANAGGTTAWPYGPPAVAASHGGAVSPAATGGRVMVAADQFFPKDQPDTGNPARYQLNYAVNMCNGSTTCGTITCSPTNLSLNWNAYYWNDVSGDYRYPSIVVDGVGWVQGSTTTPQNGVAEWPEMFMAYYYRDFKSSSLFGGANMDVAFADDEACDGFQSGAFYYFTASEKASDDDDLVVPKQGTLATFNYFVGWPGIVFNKRMYHPGGTLNDDPHFTTPGDNYTIDTTVDGVHLNAYWSFNEESFLGPWTFAWPAGFEMQIIVNPDATDNDRYYTFAVWSTGEPSTTLTVATDWCSPVPPCPVTSINALFYGGCLTSPPSVSGLVQTKAGGNVKLDWNPAGSTGDVAGYTVYRATDCSFVGNYSVVGSTANPTFTDYAASGNLYYYIVVAACGPYTGPWDHYGQ